MTDADGLNYASESNVEQIPKLNDDVAGEEMRELRKLCVDNFAKIRESLDQISQGIPRASATDIKVQHHGFLSRKVEDIRHRFSTLTFITPWWINRLKGLIGYVGVMVFAIFVRDIIQWKKNSINSVMEPPLTPPTNPVESETRSFKLYLGPLGRVV